MSRIHKSKIAIAEAEREGLKVVKSNPRRILLDLDSAEDEEFYEKHLPELREHLDVEEISRWSSRNGGLHIRMRTKRRLNVRTRLLIQACLGSDRLKEFLSLVRVWKGDANPSMLFKPPQKKKKKADWQAVRRRVTEQPMPPRPSGNEFEFDDDVPF